MIYRSGVSILGHDSPLLSAIKSQCLHWDIKGKIRSSAALLSCKQKILFNTDWRVPTGPVHSIKPGICNSLVINASKRSFTHLGMRNQSIMKMGDSVTLPIFSIAELLRLHQPHAANTNGLICLNSEVSVLQAAVLSLSTELCQGKWRGMRTGRARTAQGLLHPPGHRLFRANLSSEADRATTTCHETEQSLGTVLMIFLSLHWFFSPVFKPIISKIFQLKLLQINCQEWKSIHSASPKLRGC